MADPVVVEPNDIPLAPCVGEKVYNSLISSIRSFLENVNIPELFFR